MNSCVNADFYIKMSLFMRMTDYIKRWTSVFKKLNVYIRKSIFMGEVYAYISECMQRKVKNCRLKRKTAEKLRSVE